MRRRDSPVEYTGEAHLVTVSCGRCGASMTVSEQAADEGGPHLCEDCSGPRMSAQVVDSGDGFDVLPPTVRTEGDVHSDVLNAVEQVVEAEPNVLDAPKLWTPQAYTSVSREGTDRVAILTCRFNEIPAGDGPGWLPPYRARERFDAELRDRLPDRIDVEAQDRTTTAFYKRQPQG